MLFLNYALLSLNLALNQENIDLNLDVLLIFFTFLMKDFLIFHFFHADFIFRVMFFGTILIFSYA